jgi:hypothetical protein
MSASAGLKPRMMRDRVIESFLSTWLTAR